jgi:hypothetical protein
MMRFDLLEPLPLTTRKYIWRSLLAAGVFLTLWAVVLLTKWTAGWLVLSFPVLVIGSLCALIPLRGWKQRLLGFVCWLLLWSVAYFLGVWLLFWIAGGP